MTIMISFSLIFSDPGTKMNVGATHVLFGELSTKPYKKTRPHTNNTTTVQDNVRSEGLAQVDVRSDSGG
jgi:hypothetical protein